MASQVDSGTYSIWAEITDKNYRHADGTDGTARQIGVLTIYPGDPPAMYSVAFAAGADGVTGTMADLDGALPDTRRTLPECGFTRAGYAFSGWKLGSAIYPAGAVYAQESKNVIFTAQWARAVYKVSGIVDQDGKPVSDVIVTLMLGAHKISETRTDADGKFAFTDVAPGRYNLVGSKDGVTMTVEVILENASESAEIHLPSGKTNSIVEIIPGTPDIVVGNLEQVFAATDDSVYTSDDETAVKGGGEVEIRFTVEEKPEKSDDADQAKIQTAAGSAVPAMFLEMKLEKTVTDNGTVTKSDILESSVLVKSVVPLPTELQGKAGYKVIRMHLGAVEALTETANADGEKIEIDAGKTTLTIYARKYSTYAIAYSEAAPTPPAPGPGPVPTYLTGGGYVPTPTPKPEPAPEPEKPGKPGPDQTGVSRLLITDAHIRFMGGYNTGLFGPNDKITRAQVAQVFYNLLRDQNVSGAPYDDVPADAWYAKAVSAMRGLGIMSGVGENRFEPNRPITRGEFDVTAMRFAKLPEGGENIFTDVSESDWYYEQIIGAVQYGWIGGYGDGTYRPKNPIARAEVAKIVNNMLGRSADVGYIDAHLEELRRFPDVDDKKYWAYYEIMEAANPHKFKNDGDGEDWID